ncbi:hypothetical protein L195_g058778, partial [Trifolium pratense]
MFTIKGRKYNVEYEGLHMLCLTCGKFGHYREGCPDKGKGDYGQQGERNNSVGGEMQPPVMGGTGGDGPWKVVQKQRRSRKTGQGKNSETADGKGNNMP